MPSSYRKTSCDHNIPFPEPAPTESKFTFIDLFSGIGGFRIALQNLGGKCLFSSEYDKYAQTTYHANYGEMPFGDITNPETKSHIPSSFDLLSAGFPCQPFSIAGVSKKNSLGRKHGFDDEKQGNLFFHIAEILQKHRPKAFLLENVKNLLTHNKGETFKIIKDTLTGLGYSFDYSIVNAKSFVPQRRERLIMIGFDKSIFNENIQFSFSSIQFPDTVHKIKSILESNPDSIYTLTPLYWDYLQAYAKKHEEKGNGFSYGLVDLDGISRTMTSRYYKDGSEILIPQINKPPRKLTIRECARLQGFPDSFIIDRVSRTQIYKQLGNSVVVPLIELIGSHIVRQLEISKAV